ALGTLRIGVLVVPDFGGGLALGEEEQVGLDTGVRIEDAVGKTDDGVEVALAEEFFLDASLDALPEEGAVWQNNPRPAAGLQHAHDEDEKEIGGLAGAELTGEVGFDAVLLHAAERRVGDDDVDVFLRLPVGKRARQGIVVADIGGDVDAVQHQVGHAQYVRQV